ncbi:NADP-specific glutamate dehydrogenase [Durotheca rogersii]|uniref:NADP-specific glutamate dehydrogenase n=1 Tax=Durotheca rogersii TaxID=419775 RepID=UPI00221F0E8D|nr:NADP-specific glutamate dehydrogenase [Durotheca rogersii]KAI5867310.1 NADP-specific glutamate dehydrogenase [Durotheca rogersii]
MSHLAAEPEFEQAYKELVATLEDSTLFEEYPEYRTALSVVSIPERVIQFRVVWEDDKGNLQVNRGYRVQFNSALGPYKGGLRFHPTVNLSILKFLGFEQIFKNALTGLSMGGGKGGADFDPKGKSDNEIRRFCEAFMRRLCQHIGAETDVPAGDIGVGGREVGYMFGTYRKERNKWEGVLTGKGLSWGGSLIRPEATGYGLVYYVEHMIAYAGKGSFQGKRVAISGSGNVAQYTALKCIELGATVVSLSDSTGSLIAGGDKGFAPADVNAIAAVKLDRQPITQYSGAAAFRFVPGARPWRHVGRVDIALPCATQNEVDEEDAHTLVRNGTLFVAEGSNMGCTQAAIDVFEDARRGAKAGKANGVPKANGHANGHATNGDAANGSSIAAEPVWYAPGKASNAGGVAVSGLEMAQNSSRFSWTEERVDERLKQIMKNIFDQSIGNAKRYVKAEVEQAAPLPSLVAGGNIAGFLKVVQAMHDQGDWW